MFQRISSFLSRIKLIIVELASIVSLLLVLTWLVWKEFQHLFQQ
jgi:hypothetical protein